MIEIKLNRLGGETKLCVDFTFFAVIALFFYLDKSGLGLLSIAACAVHETGHLLVLFLEKKDFASLTLYGGGIKIGTEKNLDSSVFLILAGSLFNTLFFMLFYFVFPVGTGLKTFAVMNLVIGIFNLLPLRFFDGGRLFEKAVIRILPAEKAFSLLRKTEKITAVLAIVIPILIIILGRVNLSVLIVMIYVMISDFTTKKM